MRSVTTTLDAAFVAALLGVAAVILLPLRGSPLLENPYLAIGLIVLLPTALTAAWCACARQRIVGSSSLSPRKAGGRGAGGEGGQGTREKFTFSQGAPTPSPQPSPPAKPGGEGAKLAGPQRCRSRPWRWPR